MRKARKDITIGKNRAFLRLNAVPQYFAKKFLKAVCQFRKKATFALSKTRRVRITVSTPPFHGGNRGSIPLRGTK